MTTPLRLLILVPLLPRMLAATPGDTPLTPPPSLPADTTAVPDSLFRMTTPVYAGSLDRFLDSSETIARGQLPWMEYRFLGDILATFPGTLLADQQSEGQYSALWVDGTDWRSIAVLRDGRPLNDPASGIYNLYGFPTASADRIEMVPGPRAFLYGLNSTGAAVNLVTRNYTSNRPYSSLVYSEGGYGYTLTDGLFSQNISRRINIMAGFQSQNTDGRYRNTDDEQWNTRVKLRYSPSAHVQLIAGHELTVTKTGLNGGVDLAASDLRNAFIPIQAVLVNTDSYEKVTRHDVDISVVATLFADTADVTSLTLYSSHQLREYRDEENRIPSNGIFVQSDHTSSWMGAQVRQSVGASWHHFQAGAGIELRQIEGSPNLGRRRNVAGHLWGMEELLPEPGVRVAVFGRIDRYLHRTYGGAGADAGATLLPWLDATGGVSVSRRVPNAPELYWTGDSVTVFPAVRAERHLTLEAGVHIRPDSATSLRVTVFSRSIEDPILIESGGGGPVFPALRFANGDRIKNTGIKASLNARLWLLTLEAEGMSLLRTDGAGAKLPTLPSLSGSAGLYFWNAVLNGKLRLKAGLRARYRSAAAGERFNPEVPAYGPNTYYEPGRSSMIDALVFAHIGDADIHFLWTNLTSASVFLAPFFPVRDREIRFGIRWEFLD